MTGGRREGAEDFLARREADPGLSGRAWEELGEDLRRAVLASSSVEQELSALSLAARGHPGKVGSWVLLRPLGTGIAGPVYLAQHEGGGDRAAVRLLRGPHSDLILETSRKAEGWRDPAVLAVLETGEDWIATEVSAGVRLVHLLPTLPPEREAITRGLLRSFAAVARAIGRAHERGIVHLAVSPQKIDVDSDGRMRVWGFGFDPTRRRRPPGPASPPLGPVVHLAPEQATEGAEAGPPADVYSLASVAYTVAAGFPPFTDRSLSGVLDRIRTEPPPPLRSLVPWVPKQLAGEIGKALAKDPGARPVGPEGLAEALQAC